MWTLGFVPESEVLRRGGGVPSRPMLQTLIHVSLERIPYDSLTQYVWLHMVRDQSLPDLRDRFFFFVINYRYAQYLPDNLWIGPSIPSEIFARTLVARFMGNLDENGISDYIDLARELPQYEEIRDGQDDSDWSSFARIMSLGYILGREYDCFSADITPDRELDMWGLLLGRTIQMRDREHLNPHRPDFWGTLNHPLFQVIEQGLRPGAVPGPDGIILSLERYRAAAMVFSLTLTPPRTGSTVGITEDPGAEDVAALWEREQELIDWLRGAFFLLNIAFLPGHLMRYSTFSESKELGPGPTWQVGLQEYLEIKRRLDALYDEMAEVAGNYVQLRRNPVADVAAIVKALGKHTNRQD